MARFLVTPECAPGVSRPETGLVRPGSIFVWPEIAPGVVDVPSIRLRPVDQEAYDLLVKVHGAQKVKDQWGAEFTPITPEKPRVEVPQSPAELARNIDAAEPPQRFGKKSKRWADQ